MGCCKSRDNRNISNVDPQTHTLDLVNSHSPLNQNQSNHASNDSQQLLVNTALSTDYQSINSPIDDADNKQSNSDNEQQQPISSNLKCQTPPIIKTLFGSTNLQHLSDENNDNIDMKNVEETPTNIINSEHKNNNATPMGMGGNVYLGFADQNQRITFQNNTSLNRSSSTSQRSNSSNSESNYSNSASGHSHGSQDWIPSKPAQNPPLLMGYAQENDRVSFKESVDEMNMNEMDLEALLVFGTENSQRMSSNMSLNSAKMADLVINSSMTGLSSAKSNMSLRSNVSEGNTPQFSLKNANDFALLSRWMIASFNVLIEYIPYKAVMEVIFLFCDIDIGDPVFKHCDLDFVFPDTTALDNKYNYFDIPQIFVENVSCTHKNQPSLVLMIGAPGSGKSSYAQYRYGTHSVIAADDYFDIHYNGAYVREMVGEAHNYCMEQCLIRLKKKETVCVANTHCMFWQIYNKIITVLFDQTLPHKIVFCVMPESNPTSLVRRCVHSCTKPAIIQYLQKLKYIKSVGINCENILRFGHSKNGSQNNIYNKYKKSNLFDYGLWIEPDSFYTLQDWFQHCTNCNLFAESESDIGDGRVSPIIQERWQTFKKNMKLKSGNKNLKLSKFNASNDPFVDLEIRVIGYANHKICQMCTVEIVKESINANDKNKYFWDLFTDAIEIKMMGSVLRMRKNIPFSNAKLLFDYNCISFVNNGPILKCKLATKRWIKKNVSYLDRPPLITDTEKNKDNKNIFFSLENVSTSHDLLGHKKPKPKKSKKIENCIPSFSIKLLDRHTSEEYINNIEDEFSAESNPELFVPSKVKPTLNASAVEFNPQMQSPNVNMQTEYEKQRQYFLQTQNVQNVQNTYMPYMNSNNNIQILRAQQQQWLQQQQLMAQQQQMMNYRSQMNVYSSNNAQLQQTQQRNAYNIPTHIPTTNSNVTTDSHTSLNVNAMEFKMESANTETLQKPQMLDYSQLPQMNNAYDNNAQLQRIPQMSINAYNNETWDVPITNRNENSENGSLDVNAPAFMPSQN